LGHRPKILAAATAFAILGDAATYVWPKVCLIPRLPPSVFVTVGIMLLRNSAALSWSSAFWEKSHQASAKASFAVASSGVPVTSCLAMALRRSSLPAQAVDVGAGADGVCLSPSLFGGHVGGRPHHGSMLGDLAVVALAPPRQPKVHDRGFATLIEDDVRII
jgi:hypothetical protein